MKFRKKPVVIEAVQYQPNNQDVYYFMKETEEYILNNTFQIIGDNLHITTLEGVMTASPGDWIIRGVKGEYYPCKPDIFETTYEKVED